MKFLVLGIGGDARYGYVAKALQDDGYTVTQNPSEADVVVLPFQAVASECPSRELSPLTESM